MSTYVIGDLQGCYTEFMALLDKVNYSTGEDHLWLVGDLVNRGPDNAAVMEFIISQPDVTCVLGNHDLHFLAVARGQQTQKRKDTMDDLLTHPQLDDFVSYLRALPLVHHDADNNLVMVHAGLPPHLGLEECLSLAAEVERALQSDQLDEFLAAMYGNEPDHWDENLTGMDRLRLITNYFTRMRYCTASGGLELLHKELIAPPGFSPWFSFNREGNEKILFGHWAALEGKSNADFVTSLDTGCVWGRELTALRLEDNQLFSVPSQSGGIN